MYGTGGRTMWVEVHLCAAYLLSFRAVRDDNGAAVEPECIE